MLLLGRTASPKIFHPNAILTRSFKAVMSGLRELDVSDPVLDPRGSLNSRADSLALLGSIMKATPSLRRLSAHGWGKGFPDTATALAQALALHPVSLHSLSVGHATAVSPCESPSLPVSLWTGALLTAEGMTPVASAHSFCTVLECYSEYLH